RPAPSPRSLSRRPEIDEARPALIAGKPECRTYALAVAVPLGDPLRAKPKRGGDDQEILARGAGREHLLPFRRRRVLHHARDHGDDQGSAHKTVRLGLEPELADILLFTLTNASE